MSVLSRSRPIQTLRKVTKPLDLDLGLTARPIEEVRQVFNALATRFDEHQPSHLDPIFVAVDTGTKDSELLTRTHAVAKNPLCDIGVAFLDSRYFESLKKTPNPADHRHPVIQTHHYICDPRRNLTWRRIRGRLRFGAIWPGTVPQRKLRRFLSQIFYHDASQSTNACCKSKDFRLINPNEPRQRKTAHYRPIIVVGHALHHDLDVLDQAGFVLSQKSVLQYFDTQVIAQYLYRTDLLSLRDLCTVLGISREGLHVSGNDATFTLVALLKMASMLLEYSENVKSSEMAVELVKLVSYANEELPFRKADYEPRRGHWRVRIYGPRAIWICAGILSLAFPLGWVQIRTEKS